MQCNIVCNGTLSLGQGRLVGMHDCSSAPIVLLVEHARAAGTSRDRGDWAHHLLADLRLNPHMLSLDFWGTLKFLNSKPVHFIVKIFFYKSLMTSIPRFLDNFFQPLISWRLSEAVFVLLRE